MLFTHDEITARARHDATFYVLDLRMSRQPLPAQLSEVVNHLVGQRTNRRTGGAGFRLRRRDDVAVYAGAVLATLESMVE